MVQKLVVSFVYNVRTHVLLLIEIHQIFHLVIVFIDYLKLPHLVSLQVCRHTTK